MKKRISRILNFCAFNLLFFALYLNFVHKESNPQVTTVAPAKTVAIKGTVLVSNPEQYLKLHTKTEPAVTAQLQN